MIDDRHGEECWRSLRARKLGNIAKTGADIVSAGNIGCLQQLEGGLSQPIVHTVELLDWASGGPKPAAVDARD